MSRYNPDEMLIQSLERVIKDASPEQIQAIYRLAGIDPDTVAEETRQMLLNAVNNAEPLFVPLHCATWKSSWLKPLHIMRAAAVFLLCVVASICYHMISDRGTTTLPDRRASAPAHEPINAARQKDTSAPEDLPAGKDKQSLRTGSAHRSAPLRHFILKPPSETASGTPAKYAFPEAPTVDLTPAMPFPTVPPGLAIGGERRLGPVANSRAGETTTPTTSGKNSAAIAIGNNGATHNLGSADRVASADRAPSSRAIGNVLYVEAAGCEAKARHFEIQIPDMNKLDLTHVSGVLPGIELQKTTGNNRAGVRNVVLNSNVLSLDIFAEGKGTVTGGSKLGAIEMPKGCAGAEGASYGVKVVAFYK